MIVWALFDSGNGSYTKGIKELNEKRLCNIEVYPIGIDIEKRNNHFINLNLADYSRLFGDNTLFGTLDKLPKPDLIIASPPCESWSNASAMTGGNACWKTRGLIRQSVHSSERSEHVYNKKRFRLRRSLHQLQI